MKSVERTILVFQEDNFFFPVRGKIDYARVILFAARMLIMDNVPSMDSVCSMKLIVRKMSRLFFCKDNKFYSVSFPFTVILDEENNVIEIATYAGIVVDNRLISSALAILNDDEFISNPSPMNFWVDSNFLELQALNLIEDIFLFEPGYIRYDKDEANFKENIHPLNHLDVNYSSYGTYKIGLNNDIMLNHFEDIMNIETDCRFLK